MQAYLNYLRFDAGGIDGKFGLQTRDAISAAIKEGYPISPSDVKHRRSERICKALARKVAEDNGHPDTVFITDVAPDSAALLSARLGILAARRKLNSTAFAAVYAFQNLDILREVSGKVLGKKTLIAWSLDSNIAGLADEGVIVMRLATPQIGRSYWSVAAHEFTHVYQHDQLGRQHEIRSDGNPLDGPKWLFEGVAEYVANHVSNAKESDGQISYFRMEDLSTAKDFSLAMRFYKNKEPYVVALRGVDHLVWLVGEKKVLFDYWEERGERGKEEPWEATFERVFGISVEDFYKEL